jgi:glycosyltransferase involved in cell wall biosynthesis
MVIANSDNTSYFRWFAELNKKENAFNLSFVFITASKPHLANELNNIGYNSYWLYFDYTRKKHFQYIKVFFKLLILFIKIKPQVVQTNLFDDSLPALLAARFAGIKKRIITKQDTGYHIKYTPQYIKFDKLNNSNATDIICVSQETKELILKYEKPDVKKLRFIHHGVNEDLFSAYNKQAVNELKKKYNLQNKIVIGKVARYVESKGYKNLIEAAKEIIPDYSNIVIMGIGWGQQETELKNLIDKYNLNENFILTGKINFNEIPNFYKCMDLYIHAAEYEPFGFVIAEAMFSKVPIISTKVGAARDILTHKESAFLLKSNEPQEIVNAITYMLNINKEEMVNIAYKLAKEHYSKNAMWTKYKELFLS